MIVVKLWTGCWHVAIPRTTSEQASVSEILPTKLVKASPSCLPSQLGQLCQLLRRLLNRANRAKRMLVFSYMCPPGFFRDFFSQFVNWPSWQLIIEVFEDGFLPEERGEFGMCDGNLVCPSCNL